jgi:hypothetical protein
MVKMKKYLDFLENEESNILNMIGQIVEIESPTKDKLRNDYLAEIIRDLFIHYTGGEVEMINTEITLEVPLGKGKNKCLSLVTLIPSIP